MDWKDTVESFVEFHWRIVADAASSWERGQAAMLESCATEAMRERYLAVGRKYATRVDSLPETAYDVVSQEPTALRVDVTTRTIGSGEPEKYRLDLVSVGGRWQIDQLFVPCPECPAGSEEGKPSHACQLCNGGRRCFVCEGAGELPDFATANEEPSRFSRAWWRARFGIGLEWSRSKYWSNGNPRTMVSCASCDGGGFCIACEGRGECRCVAAGSPGWMELLDLLAASREPVPRLRTDPDGVGESGP